MILKMNKTLWVCILGVSTWCAVLAADTSKNAMLVRATNCFSTNLIPNLNTEDGNLIFSGLSVDIVLSMLQMGAGGATYEELNKALLYQDNGLSKEDVQNEMQSLLKGLQDVKNITLDIGNSAWIDKTFNVKPSYKEVVTGKFLATVENLDFQSNSGEATETINKWVNEKTHSLIPTLFDKLDPSICLVLVNVIYFKGTWVWKFDEKNTKTLPFQNNNNAAETKMVSLMNQQGEFSYTDDPNLQAKILEMKYKGDAVKFVAILPNEGVRLSDVEAKLNCDKISQILKSGTMKQVNVTIPKFDLTSTFDLQQPLTELNINSIFGFDADLSGISDGKLQLTKIVQKATIKVYEEGSEAAAVTGGGGRRPSAVREPVVIEQFNADRPFAFYILQSESGQILFAGKVNKL